MQRSILPYYVERSYLERLYLFFCFRTFMDIKSSHKYTRESDTPAFRWITDRAAVWFVQTFKRLSLVIDVPTVLADVGGGCSLCPCTKSCLYGCSPGRPLGDLSCLQSLALHSSRQFSTGNFVLLIRTHVTSFKDIFWAGKSGKSKAALVA